MKRHIFLLLCILITSFCAYSQDRIQSDEYSAISTNTISSEYAGNSAMSFDYKNTQEWGKYKALRAVGWSTFGVGLALTSVGLTTGVIALCGGYNLHPALIATTIAGGTLTISSVPLLITAYHYRNKAKRMALNIGMTSINTPSISNRTEYTPALSFTLNF